MILFFATLQIIEYEFYFRVLQSEDKKSVMRAAPTLRNSK